MLAVAVDGHHSPDAERCGLEEQRGWRAGVIDPGDDRCAYLVEPRELRECVEQARSAAQIRGESLVREKDITSAVMGPMHEAGIGQLERLEASELRQPRAH